MDILIYLPIIYTIGVIMTINIGEGMRRLWSRDLQNIVSAVRSGTFEYKEKEGKLIDWSKYDAAQVNEITDILQMINDAVDAAYGRVISREPKKKRPPGKPLIPADDIAKIMLLQCYFGFSNRVSAGFLKIFTAIKFSKSFSYKTVERGYDPDRTKPIFDEVFRLTNEWSNFNGDMTGFDGTGDPNTIKINYENKRSEQRAKIKRINGAWPSKKHDFQYSVIGAGMYTKIISGFSSTDNHHIGELSQFPNSMRQTHLNIPNLAIVVGDTLYACRSVCKQVSNYGAALYSLPKSNCTLKSYGVRDWKRMVYGLILDPQGFLEIFHNRSISETVNSMMKRREPIPIRKRIPWRKDVEEFLKVNIHNLRQSCYLSYLAPTTTRIPLHGG